MDLGAICQDTMAIGSLIQVIWVLLVEKQILAYCLCGELRMLCVQKVAHSSIVLYLSLFLGRISILLLIGHD